METRSVAKKDNAFIASNLDVIRHERACRVVPLEFSACLGLENMRQPCYVGTRCKRSVEIKKKNVGVWVVVGHRDPVVGTI